MMPPRVLVAYDFSATVRDAFLTHGYDACIFVIFFAMGWALERATRR